MRGLIVRLLSVFTGAMLIATATTPIGTVTAPSPIRISGAEVPATAAASVPFGIGDEISTTGSTALIRFEQRGVVILGKNSALKILTKSGQTMVCLIEGSYQYKFLADSKLSVCRDEKPLATSLDGSLSMGSHLKTPVFASDGERTAPIAGAAATRSKNCPPGHGDGHDCSVTK